MLQNLCGGPIVVTFNYFFMELVGTIFQRMHSNQIYVWFLY